MPADVVVTIAGLVLNVTVPSDHSGSSFMFDYTVTDPSGLAATAVVTIDVTGTPPTTTTTTTTTDHHDDAAAPADQRRLTQI